MNGRGDCVFRGTMLRPAPRSVFLAAILSLASSVFVAHAETISGRVVSIADGDTLTLLDSSNQQHRIRLGGIDAPEKKQPFGTRSKQNLSVLAFAKYATVEYAKRDRYGRIVGKVIVQLPQFLKLP